MKKYVACFLLLSGSVIYFNSCSKKEETPPPSATCTDGTQNQGETGIDCGGPCAPCPAAPSCTDGIQNQNETDVDCGGPCPACPSCTDGIQNQGETGIDCGGPCPACNLCNNGILDAGEIQIDCGGPSCPPCPVSTMTCQVDGANWTASNPVIVFGGGNYILSEDNASADTSITIVLGTSPQMVNTSLGSNSFLYFGTNSSTGISGTLTITAWDEVKHLVSGMFDFTTGNNDITNGTFENVYYQ